VSRIAEVTIRPTILDRYIVASVTRPFLAVSLLLVSVFVAYSLARYLSEANEGVLNADAVFRLTGLKSLIALEVLLPIALYIGFIVGLGRLYSDWEVVAFRSSGISEFRLMLPALFVAALVAIATSFLSLVIRPWAYTQLYDTEAQAEAETDLTTLPTGQFHALSSGGRTVFVGQRDADDDELHRIFLRRGEGDELEVVSATAGVLHEADVGDAHTLELKNAVIYKLGEDRREMLATLSELTVKVPGFEPDEVGYKTKAAATQDLLQSQEPKDQAELQWRLSNAVSALLLAGVALPLGRTRPRSGRYARIIIAAVIYAFYYNVLGVVRSGVEQGTLDHLWWAPLGLAVLLATVLLLQRRSGI